jgi:hypothetical protein
VEIDVAIDVAIISEELNKMSVMESFETAAKETSSKLTTWRGS